MLRNGSSPLYLWPAKCAVRLIDLPPPSFRRPEPRAAMTFILEGLLIIATGLLLMIVGALHMRSPKVDVGHLGAVWLILGFVVILSAALTLAR
jgi:hypothetical protein